MSAYNGSGTFVISGTGLPYVFNTTISETVANTLNSDLATGLSTCITKDGQTVPTANIPLGGFKITGLGNPTAAGDALSYGVTGSWTPVDASGASLSLTATGTYVRLGSIILANAVVTYPVTANGSNAKVGGLPFTVKDTPNSSVPFAVANPTLAIYDGQVLQNTATMQFIAGTSFVTNAGLSATTMKFLAIYPI